MTATEPRQILIEYLRPNPWQPRQYIDQGQLKVLADTIKRYGFNSFLEARIAPNNPDHFQLVFGHRRRQAAQLAGLQTLPVVLKDYSDKQMAELAMLENATQEQLPYYDQGMAYIRMHEEHGYRMRDLAKLFNVSLGFIMNRVAIARLPEGSPIVAAAKQGQADMTTLLTLKYLEREITPASIQELLDAAVRGELKADQLKQVRAAIRQVNENLNLVDDETGKLHVTVAQALALDDEVRQDRKAIERSNVERYQEFTERERRGEGKEYNEFEVYGRRTDETDERHGETNDSAETAGSVIDDLPIPKGMVKIGRDRKGWQAGPKPPPDGLERARWVINQIENNVRHLRHNLTDADFSLLSPEERAAWERTKDEIIELLTHAATVHSSTEAIPSPS